MPSRVVELSYVTNVAICKLDWLCDIICYLGSCGVIGIRVDCDMFVLMCNSAELACSPAAAGEPDFSEVCAPDKVNRLDFCQKNHKTLSCSCLCFVRGFLGLFALTENIFSSPLAHSVASVLAMGRSELLSIWHILSAANVYIFGRNAALPHWQQLFACCVPSRQLVTDVCAFATIHNITIYLFCQSYCL